MLICICTYSVPVCPLGIDAQPCCRLDLRIWSCSSLISAEQLDLATPNRFVFSRCYSYKSETEYVTECYSPGLCRIPWSSNLLTRDYFYQLPLFLGFTIHCAPILYLFQGRPYRNKTREHLHVNNSHVGHIAVSCVTKMRKVLLVWSANGEETSELHCQLPMILFVFLQLHRSS